MVARSPFRNFFTFRVLAIGFWIGLAVVALYLFLFHREASQKTLSDLMSSSLWVASAIYLLLTILRGFIFLPAFPLVVIGIAFFPPGPLFVLTLAGILIPVVFIYHFPSAFPIREILGSRTDQLMDKVKLGFKRGGLPIIAAWSFIPFTPTNVIVYVAGELRYNFRKLLLGVTVGSGANCALYIFVGDYILRASGLK